MNIDLPSITGILIAIAGLLTAIVALYKQHNDSKISKEDVEIKATEILKESVIDPLRAEITRLTNESALMRLEIDHLKILQKKSEKTKVILISWLKYIEELYVVMKEKNIDIPASKRKFEADLEYFVNSLDNDEVQGE